MHVKNVHFQVQWCIAFPEYVIIAQKNGEAVGKLCTIMDTVIPAVENYHYNPTHEHLMLRNYQPKKRYDM